MHPLNKICQIFNRFRKVPPPEPIHATGDTILLDKGDTIIIHSITIEGYVMKNGVKIPYYHEYNQLLGGGKVMGLGDTFVVTGTFTTTMPVSEK